MALSLQIHPDYADASVPLEVDSVHIDQFRELSLDQIRRHRIWHGKVELDLAEAFHVSGDLSDGVLVWQGDLSRVHWIGAHQSSGTMHIEGNAGRHVGSQMSGGVINVNGSVSDFVGVQMTGGQIRISGDAGNRVGARYPGSQYGMNRGSILIEGSVGNGCGENMRRGTILVGGDAGEAAGWNMLAGTICVSGCLGPNTGAGMVRGSILCCGPSPNLLPTFVRGYEHSDLEWVNLMSVWINQQNWSPPNPLANRRFEHFSGDHLYGGRGEIWVTSS